MGEISVAQGRLRDRQVAAGMLDFDSAPTCQEEVEAMWRRVLCGLDLDYAELQDAARTKGIHGALAVALLGTPGPAVQAAWLEGLVVGMLISEGRLSSVAR